MDRFAYSRNGGGVSDISCLIRVQFTDVELVKNHGEYHMSVVNVQTGQSWQVVRRFSEFHKLRNELMQYFEKAVKKCPGCVNYEKVIHLFEFPKKHVFTSATVPVLNYRKKALKAFVSLLASHTFTTTPKCPTCSGFAFTAVRDFLTEEMVAPGGLVTESERLTSDSLRESMDVKAFTTYHPVSNIKPVNSEGKFTDSKRGARSHDKTSQRKPADKSAAIDTQRSKRAVQKPAPVVTKQEVRSLASSRSSTESSSNPASPARHADSDDNSEEEESKEEEGEGSFVSFTVPKSTVDPPMVAKKISMVEEKQGSTKTRFNFTKQSDSRHSMEIAHGAAETKEDDDFGSINLDFMKNVSGVYNEVE